MTQRPVGEVVSGWREAADPADLQLSGIWTDMRPLGASDAPALWSEMKGHDWLWDYLSPEPPQTEAALAQIVQGIVSDTARPAYAICAKGTDTALGYATYYTVDRANGSNEIGNVNLSPALQRTRMATEAFHMMSGWAFANGYRRMEWKCNALNAPSRRAATRLGFSFEGVFRNHMVIKGRNRDTAWFAITLEDWVQIGAAQATWLDPENFDGSGTQKQSLRALTEPHLYRSDPG